MTVDQKKNRKEVATLCKAANVLFDFQVKSTKPKYPVKFDVFGKPHYLGGGQNRTINSVVKHIRQPPPPTKDVVVVSDPRILWGTNNHGQKPFYTNVFLLQKKSFIRVFPPPNKLPVFVETHLSWMIVGS